MTDGARGQISLHALWCDDIRQEVGNKPSFMGVYTGALVVPQLPLTLPKLCVWLTVTAPLSLALHDLVVSVKLEGGGELLRLPVPDEPTSAEEALPALNTGAQQVRLALELAPLNLPADATALTVEVSVRGEDAVVTSLPVMRQPAVGG
jgi:hypothetical protein